MPAGPSLLPDAPGCATPCQPAIVVGPTKLIELHAERSGQRHAYAEHAAPARLVSSGTIVPISLEGLVGRRDRAASR